jgi:hypothetical protein
MRSIALVVASLAALPAFADEPDLSSPPATVRSYLTAVKANDIEAAKRCWVIDDNNASGALDVIVGMWVASRKLVAVTQANLGAGGVKHLGRWNRPNCSDRAIDLTLERLATAESKELKTIAKLTFAWQPGEGETTPAFMYVKVPLCFRRIDEQWKLDANVFTGCKDATEMFAPMSIWSVCRDEMAVMNDLTAAIEKGQFKDATEFERELQARVAVLKAKYERKD